MLAENLSRPALSDMLREGTRDAHRAAERGPAVRAFLRGDLERAAYVRLLGGFWRVYLALEAGLVRHRAHPCVGPLVLAELFRSQALAADLWHFLGPGWLDSLPPSPAGERYALHLGELAERDPTLLVAHAYTRYLGDLSGGQVLRARAAAALGLSERAGLSFYDFPQIRDHAAFKADYRARLDALPIDDPDALVAEAREAFTASAALLAELA
jgi:heme oxygenase